MAIPVRELKELNISANIKFVNYIPENKPFVLIWAFEGHVYSEAVVPDGRGGHFWTDEIDGETDHPCYITDAMEILAIIEIDVGAK